MSDQSEYAKKIWLNSYEQGVNSSVDFKDILIPQYLEESTQNFPDNPALIFQGFTLSFKELGDIWQVLYHSIQ